MTKLSELLNEAKGDSSVDHLIAEAERRHEVEISHTARSGIYRALKGEHAKSPRDASLVLWAMVFSLDVRKVREAADRPAGELGPWQPTQESAQLDRDQRLALDQLIKTIVRGRASDADERPTKNAPDSGSGDVRILRHLEPYEVDVAARPDPKAPRSKKDQQ